MEATSHLYSELRLRGFFDVYWLRHFAIAYYPGDDNFALWTWKVLLRDLTFFRLMYGGFPIAGRDFAIDIRHALTGQTREDWLVDGGSFDDLLRPELWVIDILSLQLAYPKLYVHDDGGCQDDFRYHRVVQQSPGEFERNTTGLDKVLLARQAKIQGLNPCIYTLLYDVLPLLPSRRSL